MVWDKIQIGFAASILIVTTAENDLGLIIRKTVLFTAFKFRHCGLIFRKFEKAESVSNTGRGGKIRTCDPLLPKQVRYQTALRPDGITLTHNTPYFKYKPNMSDLLILQTTCSMNYS